MTRFIRSTALALLMLVPAQAQDIAGVWQGTLTQVPTFLTIISTKFREADSCAKVR